MKVILLEKVINLGLFGEIVNVRDGYARNFLIPNKKACRASDSALKNFEEHRLELDRIQIAKLASAEQLAEQISNFKLKIYKKSSVDGRLFGSVTALEITKILKKSGFDTIEKSQLSMPKNQIKYLGEFPIKVTLHPNVIKEMIVYVVNDPS